MSSKSQKQENNKLIARRLEAQREFEIKLKEKRPTEYVDPKSHFFGNQPIHVARHNRPGRKRKNKINKFAESLRKKQIRSELWFNSKYEEYLLDTDEFNQPFGDTFIPDIINRKFKYVIEIDGSIHCLERIKKKDKIKNETYERCGYAVVRVIAYNNQSFKNAIDVILTIRKGEITT